MRFKRLLFLLLLIIIPISIGFHSPEAVQWSRNLSLSLFQPVLEATFRIRTWTLAQVDFLKDFFELHSENRAMRQKIEALEHEISRHRELQYENERLRELLKFQKESHEPAVAAQVIARDVSHWSHYVVINQGSENGVRPDTAVVTGKGLVGKVTSTAPYLAHVILLIDSDSRAGAMIQDTRDTGLVEGTGTELLRMTYLDLHASVQIGQTVVSSGLGGIYPKGIPIGQIVQIGETDDKLGLYAMVKPFVDFPKLEEVLCLTGRNPKAP